MATSPGLVCRNARLRLISNSRHSGFSCLPQAHSSAASGSVCTHDCGRAYQVTSSVPAGATVTVAIALGAVTVTSHGPSAVAGGTIQCPTYSWSGAGGVASWRTVGGPVGGVTGPELQGEGAPNGQVSAGPDA